ncbi:unnamed protein product, partial [Ectocarpus fasciculatus]
KSKFEPKGTTQESREKAIDALSEKLDLESERRRQENKNKVGSFRIFTENVQYAFVVTWRGLRRSLTWSSEKED